MQQVSFFIQVFWGCIDYPGNNLNFLTEETMKLLERKLHIFYSGELKVYNIAYNIDGSGCWYFITLFFVVVFR